MNSPAAQHQRVPAKPKAASTALLWINKDATSNSLMKMNKNERSRINSHVQQTSSHRPRGRKKLLLNVSPPDPSVDGKLPNEAIRESPLANSSSKEAKDQARPPPSIASTATFSHDSINRDESILPAKPKNTPLVWPIQYADKAVDPFACTSITIDAQTHGLLQLWLAHFQIWFVDLKSTKAKQDRVMSSSHDIILNSIHDDLSMRCLLAYVCSLKENHMMNDKASETNTPIFVDRAISALRRRIAAPGAKIDNTLIRAIYNLALAEWFRYNSEEGAMPHFRTVKLLVDKQGGLGKLDHQLRMAVIMADVYLAVERLSPPLFPLTWDPGPLPKTVWDKILPTTDPKLGQGFIRDMALFKDVHKLHETIIDIVDLSTAEKFDAEYAGIGPQIGEWISLRQMAVLHRLMSLQIDESLPSRQSLAAVQIALVLWILLAMTKWIRQTLGPLIAPRFRAALQRCQADDAGFFEKYPEIALWMLATGAMTPAKAETKAWFVEELGVACRRLKLTTGADLIRRLKEYLYLDKMRDLGLDDVLSSLHDLH